MVGTKAISEPVPALAVDFLKSKFRRMHGMTDINKSLIFAKKIYDGFMKNGDLSKYKGPKNVRPIMHTVFDKNSIKKIVPNVRVLIYTDGMDTESSRIINPFKSTIIKQILLLMKWFF